MPLIFVCGVYAKRAFCFVTEKYASYLGYLESAHWRALRKEAFNRAGNRCEACGSSHDLRGHHLIYHEDLTTHTAEDIMALCEPCHDRWHKWMKDNAKKVSDFCRQSTRGGILVLRSIRVDKPISERPKYDSQTISVKKLSKKQQKQNRREERAEATAERNGAAQLKALKKQKRTELRDGLLSMPQFVEILTGSKSRDEFKRRLRILTTGWDKRPAVMANAWVIYEKGIRLTP